MAYNLMQQGQYHKNTVDALAGALEKQESGRNRTNDSIEAAEDQQRSSTIGSFAGMGLQEGIKRGAFSTAQEAAPVIDAGSTTAEINSALSANGGTAPIVDAVGSGTAGDVALAKELGMAEQTLAASESAAITDAAGAALSEQAVAGTALESAAAGTAEAIATDAAVAGAANTAATTAATTTGTTVAGGTVAGAEAGAALGPWGIAAGAAIGLLASGLF